MPILSRRNFLRSIIAAPVVAIVEPKITYFLPPPKGWTAYKVEEGEALFYLPREYYKSVIIDSGLYDDETRLVYDKLISSKERFKYLTYAQMLTPGIKEILKIKKELGL